MSLLKFLKAGRSLVGGGGESSRYRLPCRRVLPRFAAKENPFRATSLPETAHTGGESQTVTGHLPLGEEPCEPAQALARIVEPAGVIPAAAAEAAQSAAGAVQAPTDAPRPAGRIKSWAGRLQNWWQSGGRPARPAIPRFSRTPVQAELSLDQVRVVRNDLSESDGAMGGAKRAAAQLDGASPVNGLATAGRWERVSARLFGAGKT